MMSENNDAPVNAPESVSEKPATSDVHFRDLLPDQYKEMYPQFKKPEDFVKGYDELYRKFGSAINLPKEDAPREEWDKVYNKLGRPEAPDQYQFEVEDNTKVDNDFLGKFKQVAHEAGVSQKQAKQMFDWYTKEATEIETKYQQEAETNQQQAIADLKTRWGKDYEKKLAETQNFAKSLSGEEYYDKIVKYGNDPDFITVLHSLQSQYAKEDHIPATGKVYTEHRDLNSEATKLMSDSDYKFNTDKQTRVRQLYQELAKQQGQR